MTITRVTHLTMPTKAVLAALLADDSETGIYGLQLAKDLDLPTGTIYPILVRLVRNGYATAAWEQLPEDTGKPRRRFYRLTEQGRAAAAEHLTRPSRHAPKTRTPG